MCDVSVIIPVYNIENEVLIQCVKSVVEQKAVDLEIFIIDDGSKAECAELCDELKKWNFKIEVIHQRNQGVSVARNEGIKRADGKWIAFVDADDWIDVDMLSVMTAYGNKMDADIVMCDCFVNYSRKQVETHFFDVKKQNLEDFDKDRVLLNVLSPRICNDKVNVIDIGVPWAKIYRNDFIRENNLFFDKTLRRMQDNIFNLYAFEYARSIHYIHLPLYHYRKSINSGLYKYNSQIVEIYDTYFQRALKYIDLFEKGEMFGKALNYKVFFSIYVILNNDILNDANKTTLKDKKDKLLSILKSPYYVKAIDEIETEFLNQKEKIFFLFVRYKFFAGMYIALKMKKAIYNIIGKGVKK